jgi:hypothetical protein
VGFVPALDKNAGGVFQYSATMMDALRVIAKQEKGIQLVALLPDGVSGIHAQLEAEGWRVVPLTPPAGRLRRGLRRVAGEGWHRDAWRWLRRRAERRSPVEAASGTAGAVPRRDDLGEWWRANAIELVIFPQPHPWVFETGVPGVVAIHDLQHRLQPEFPEVSAAGEWERREYVLRNCARSATSILVDSEVGKEHVLLFYGPYGAK